MRRRNLSLVGPARSARGFTYVGAASRAAQSGAARPPRLGGPTGFTLVELLLAMAVTLIMMGAVVTLFANVSESVRNRRATIEMSGQLRHTRNVLQADLAGATCPGATWRRPEENQGYIEIIEGPYRDSFPSSLTDGVDESTTPPVPNNFELDPALSIVPRNDVVRDYNDDGRIDDTDRRLHLERTDSFVIREDPSDPNSQVIASVSGLGDFDDILMLTVRNEHEPFVGRVPASVRPHPTNPGVLALFADWNSETLESPLAEVIWFAVENPATDESADGFFGEPGMRTIYRRTLLIAPWINPYRHVASNGTVTDTFSYDGGQFRAEPGLVRILPQDIDASEALAALIAFQDRYDLSVRLEWDPIVNRWKILANTLGDLTKRENRFGHYGHFAVSGVHSRHFPFAMVSRGRDYGGSPEQLAFVTDPELADVQPPPTDARAFFEGDGVASYRVLEPGGTRVARPFVHLEQESRHGATARAMLNDDGQVVRVIHGPAPLWGTRRGEDVMLTDVLAFDLRVYDPGAPLFGHVGTQTVLEPNDYGWHGVPAAPGAFRHADNMQSDGLGAIGQQNLASNVTFPFVGQGAYVDLGYGYNASWNPIAPPPRFAPGFSTAATPWFYFPRAVSDVYGTPLAPGYSVYDTWSFHYENNGLNEDEFVLIGNLWQLIGDQDPVNEPVWRRLPDTATDGLDRSGAFGPDSIDERETTPPYDKPLRGAQVLIRVYERDSRQIRQVRVNQHFLPE